MGLWILHGTVSVRVAVCSRLGASLAVCLGALHAAVWARCSSFFLPFTLAFGAFASVFSRLSTFALTAMLLLALVWSDAWGLLFLSTVLGLFTFLLFSFHLPHAMAEPRAVAFDLNVRLEEDENGNLAFDLDFDYVQNLPGKFYECACFFL